MTGVFGYAKTLLDTQTGPVNRDNPLSANNPLQICNESVKTGGKTAAYQYPDYETTPDFDLTAQIPLKKVFCRL